MVANSLFTSKTEEWETPQKFFDTLNEQYNFGLDVCATAENAKCKDYYTKENDALSLDWNLVEGRTIWCNPPYGKTIGLWMAKAYEESKYWPVVCLVPARTDTKWWHDWVEGKAKVVFIKGRLKFGTSKNSAPFPSALVIYE